MAHTKAPVVGNSEGQNVGEAHTVAGGEVGEARSAADDAIAFEGTVVGLVAGRLHGGRGYHRGWMLMLETRRWMPYRFLLDLKESSS